MKFSISENIEFLQSFLEKNGIKYSVMIDDVEK